MKTELLSLLDTLDITSSQLRAKVNELPDDPLPPDAPTGLTAIKVTYYSYGNGPLVIGISWSDGPSGCTPNLEYRGSAGNPAGPTEWTPMESSEGGGDQKGTLVLQNPVGQAVEFRVSFSLGGLTGEFSDTLSVNADDLIGA